MITLKDLEKDKNFLLIPKDKEYLLIPEKDIEQIEETRKRLIEITSQIPNLFNEIIFKITPSLYYLTHRKYLKITLKERQNA